MAWFVIVLHIVFCFMTFLLVVVENSGVNDKPNEHFGINFEDPVISSLRKPARAWPSDHYVKMSQGILINTQFYVHLSIILLYMDNVVSLHTKTCYIMKRYIS